MTNLINVYFKTRGHETLNFFSIIKFCIFSLFFSFIRTLKKKLYHYSLDHYYFTNLYVLIHTIYLLMMMMMMI